VEKINIRRVIVTILNLAYFRKMNGLSQSEVANKLNITRQAVSQWETKKSSPDIDKILDLAKLYNVDVKELLSSPFLFEQYL